MQAMEKLAFHITADQKFSRRQHVLLVAVTLAAACLIAGWAGLFVLAGCVGLAIRGRADAHKAEQAAAAGGQRGKNKIDKVTSVAAQVFMIGKAAAVLAAHRIAPLAAAVRQRAASGLCNISVAPRLLPSPAALA